MRHDGLILDRRGAYAEQPRGCASSSERARLQLTRVVEAVGGDGVVVVERDDDRRYLHADQRGRVRCSPLDDVEFRLDAETRAVYALGDARESIFVYPLQQPLSGAGTNMAAGRGGSATSPRSDGPRPRAAWRPRAIVGAEEPPRHLLTSL